MLLFSLSPHLSDSISYQLRNPLPSILENIHLRALIEQLDEETPPAPDQRAAETTRSGFRTTAGGRAVMTLPFLITLLRIHISPSLPPLSSCARLGSPSLRSSWFPREGDLLRHLAACLHFAFLIQRRLRMPVCARNQWHFKLSLWLQSLCVLVQLVVLIIFMM